MTTMTRATPPTLAPIAIHFHCLAAGSTVPTVGEKVGSAVPTVGKKVGSAVSTVGEKVGSPGLNHALIPDIFAPIAASISLWLMTII